MIIEALTAVTAIGVTIETLEIIHYLRVGHETGKDVCEAGSFLAVTVKQWAQKKDQEDPIQKLVREAKTPYDFHATGDAAQALQAFNERAQKYLTQLIKSLEYLGEATESFAKTHYDLKQLFTALKLRDEQDFLSHLPEFKFNFKRFKNQLKLFSLLIKAPDRHLLYIADIVEREKVIRSFNKYLANRDDLFNDLKKTKEEITTLFKSIPSLSLPAEASSISSLFFDELTQKIKRCMDKPALIPETMKGILSENTMLATFCTDIAQISAELKQIDSTGGAYTGRWDNDPNWRPLLTKEEQIRVGQGIFLHAMDESDHSREEKFNLAEIFLRQYVSEDEIKQVIIDLHSEELANSLTVQQIKKCEELSQFLKALEQGGSCSREHDPDGLLQWLEVGKNEQNSVELWIKILVLPYCLSQCHIESLGPKLALLLPYENTEILIEKYRTSYWGAIREKSDQLIQLPVSFKTKIVPNDRFEVDDPSSGSNTVFSSSMSRLSRAMTLELETLKKEFNSKKNSLNKRVAVLRGKEKNAREAKKILEHDNGVGRIKKSHQYLATINREGNSLYPYLYHPRVTNGVDTEAENTEAENKIEKEVEKEEWKVPTVDDLLQVIYRGVDLHGLCQCKNDSDSKSRPLVNYFYPNQADDARMQAFAYASEACHISAMPLLLLSLHSHPQEPVLAIGSGEEKNPYLLVLLENNKKVLLPLCSMALNNLTPKIKEEAETVITQLGDYYNLAFTRLNPKLHYKLPLVEKFKLLVQSLFKLGSKIREERFKSVQIIMGKLEAVVSAQDIKSINLKLDEFNSAYEVDYKGAKKTNRSTLYTLMNKAVNGCISSMRHQMPEDEEMKFKLNEEKIETLEKTVEELMKEKETMGVKLEESEAQRVKDQEAMGVKLEESEAQRVKDQEAMEAMGVKLEESEAQRVKDQEAMGVKLEESEAQRVKDQEAMEAELAKMKATLAALSSAFFRVQEPGSRPSASNTEQREGSVVPFFKP